MSVHITAAVVLVRTAVSTRHWYTTAAVLVYFSWVYAVLKVRCRTPSIWPGSASLTLVVRALYPVLFTSLAMAASALLHAV